MAAGSGNLLVLGTSSGGGHAVESYSYTGTHGSAWALGIAGLGTSYDCGYLNNYVWLACSAADSPVRCYNTSGAVVSTIPGSLTGGAAHGLDTDQTNGFLWVSNMNNDKIYKIGFTGTEERQGAPVPSSLSASCNPFSGSVEITGAAAPGSRIEVFDASGRIVREDLFDGSFVLSGTGLPGGSYIVRVTGGGGGTLRLVKL